MKIFWQAIIIAIVSITLGILSNTLSPNKIDWTGKIVDMSEVKIHKLSLEKAHELYTSENVIFIDARYPADYKEGHIHGAINLPVNLFDQYYPRIETFIRKDEQLIIYCSGPECSLSAILADILNDFGYSKLMLFEEGFDAWQDACYPVEKGK